MNRNKNDNYNGLTHIKYVSFHKFVMKLKNKPRLYLENARKPSLYLKIVNKRNKPLSLPFSYHLNLRYILGTNRYIIFIPEGMI